MKLKEISTDRGLFAYREYGKPTNPPIVMIHGWPETSYAWHHVASLLEDKYRPIAIDLRGAGGSNRVLDKALYSKDQLSSDIYAVLDKLGIDSFYLAGHDWGSAVVQEMAFAQPNRIKKLVLLNMVIIHNKIGKAAAYKVLGQKLFYSFWYQFFQNLKELPEILIKGKENEWVRFFMRGMSSSVPEESIAEYVKSYQIEGSITCAANLYRTMGIDAKRWQSYEGQKIPIPAKMIYGNLDPVIIREYLTDIESCFEDISISELDTGHFVMDEKPKEVAEIMKGFLA